MSETGNLGEVRRQRDLLRIALDDLEAAVEAPVALRREAWVASVEEALAEVRVALEEHVAVSEGPDGLHADVMARAPRLAHAVHTLQADHKVMLEECEAVSAKVAAVGDDATDAREGALALLAHVARHRHQGANMVFEAYNVDLSVGD